MCTETDFYIQVLATSAADAAVAPAPAFTTITTPPTRFMTSCASSCDTSYNVADGGGNVVPPTKHLPIKEHAAIIPSLYDT